MDRQKCNKGFGTNPLGVFFSPKDHLVSRFRMVFLISSLDPILSFLFLRFNVLYGIINMKFIQILRNKKKHGQRRTKPSFKAQKNRK
jgi:hypothetical protein